MNEYEIKRENFIKPFKGDPVLIEKIPEITNGIFERQFGINIMDYTHTVPIVFSVGMKHILKFIKSQPSAQFSLDIGGLCIEYVTDYSESDKPTNIVPQMRHTKKEIFVESEMQNVSASEINDTMVTRYQTWRNTNNIEVYDKIEQDVENEVRTTYGIYLMHSIAVIPMILAAYTAGVIYSNKNHVTVNMYGFFEIDTLEEDGSTILTPLAQIKQALKDDDKK